MVLAFLFAVTQCAALADTAPSKEYGLKAAFLFNFAGFVEWPARAFAAPDAPLEVAVLGDDPFHGVLEETVRGEKVAGHAFTVRHYHAVAEIQNCHILFISAAEADNIDAVLATLKGRAILTVSDAKDFAARGGMIQFVTENNRIRLRINLEAAKAAQLVLSSKLLRPAEIIQGKN